MDDLFCVEISVCGFNVSSHERLFNFQTVNALFFSHMTANDLSQIIHGKLVIAPSSSRR